MSTWISLPMIQKGWPLRLRQRLSSAVRERPADASPHPIPSEVIQNPVWWLTKDGDLDCLELYERHYSANTYADGRQRRLFVGPGEKVVLRTRDADAMFVWRKCIDDCIDQRTGERQQGVNCAVFRNESPHRSSDLIRQADAIADLLWPHCRHYTYVNREKVASKNPGFCFQAAGWSRCGSTAGGLLVLERLTHA